MADANTNNDDNTVIIIQKCYGPCLQCFRNMDLIQIKDDVNDNKLPLCFQLPFSTLFSTLTGKKGKSRIGGKQEEELHLHVRCDNCGFTTDVDSYKLYNIKPYGVLRSKSNETSVTDDMSYFSEATSSDLRLHYSEDEDDDDDDDAQYYEEEYDDDEHHKFVIDSDSTIATNEECESLLAGLLIAEDDEDEEEHEAQIPSHVCIKCETELEEHWRFCPHCGVFIEDSMMIDEDYCCDDVINNNMKTHKRTRSPRSIRLPFLPEM